MRKERTHRKANAVLERGKYSWIWVVRHCPYCRKCHDHYGGPLDGDPHRYLKWRACAYWDIADRQQWQHRHPAMSFSYVLTTAPLSAQPQRRKCKAKRT